MGLFLATVYLLVEVDETANHYGQGPATDVVSGAMQDLCTDESTPFISWEFKRSPGHGYLPKPVDVVPSFHGEVRIDLPLAQFDI